MRHWYLREPLRYRALSGPEQVSQWAVIVNRWTVGLAFVAGRVHQPRPHGVERGLTRRAPATRIDEQLGLPEIRAR